MSSLYPPLVALLSLSNVAGTNTGTVIPAPGIGQAILVKAVQIGISRLTTGIVDARLTAPSLGNFANGWGMSLNGDANVYPIIPEPGVLLAANEALSLITTSTAAPGSTVATVLYRIVPFS
jgi:hypothetical protein